MWVRLLVCSVPCTDNSGGSDRGKKHLRNYILWFEFVG